MTQLLQLSFVTDLQITDYLLYDSCSDTHRSTVKPYEASKNYHPRLNVALYIIREAVFCEHYSSLISLPISTCGRGEACLASKAFGGYP